MVIRIAPDYGINWNYGNSIMVGAVAMVSMGAAHYGIHGISRTYILVIMENRFSVWIVSEG